ncbi:AbrB/MazE/SpoVT family DNA-binding domain-containing protein [Priestia aryabhattai]|uniref:AbrB/MazE/SpoVT family DNA-binding domain-containing protein n=1 Tax=Priestia megaterium TaxID=1404 RepID=UPI003F9A58B1
MKENESFKEHQMIDNMGRIEIPSLFLKHANIQLFARMQFFNYKNCFVMKQIKSPSSCLKEKVRVNNFVRTIDNLGRIVIPKTLREIHDMNLCEQIGIKLINKSILSYKITNENESLDQIKEAMDFGLNSSSLFKLKGGGILLTDFVLKSLDLEINMQLQFFIKNQDTIVIKKHRYNFSTKGNLSFTGQSRIINKYKHLTIPKKLRDYLNINNGDILEAKIVKDMLVIKKAN